MKPERSEFTQSLSPTIPVLVDAAYYLIKLCTHDNETLFGTFTEGQFQLNGMGQIAADEWIRSAQPYRDIVLDQWIILPSYLQGIVVIREALSTNSYGPSRSHKPRLLSSFIAGYKAAVAKRINLLRNHPGGVVWQRSYQERLIPDEAVLRRVRQMLKLQQL